MLRLLILTGILGIWLAGAVTGEVLVNPSETDLGRIYRDEPQKIVFEFENASDDSLHILDIEPSCDCTTAEAVPEAAGPREQGRVLVFFDPMGYEGKGRTQEYVRITTTDLLNPEIFLLFWAEVAIGPEPEPRALRFGRICRGESDTLGITITPGVRDTLTVYDAFSDTACVIVEPVGSPRGPHDFRVIATNEEGCGRVASLITFRTSDEIRPEIRVPVSLSLVGRIVAEPDIIAFGPTLPGSYVAQTVKVYSRQGLKFEISTLSSSTEYLQPEVTRLGDSSCELRIRIREGSPPGRVAGEIRLETDCPDESPLDIRVNGYIRSEK